MTFPQAPSPNAPFEGSTLERPRPGGVRVVLVSLAISAVLHFLAIVFYAVFMGRMAAPTAVAVRPGPVVRPEGMQVLRISELPAPPSGNVERPQEPETRQPQSEPAPTNPLPSQPSAGRSEPATPLPSAAERLRPPEHGDPRIWRPVAPELTKVTPEERARLRLYARLEQLADSMLTAEERERRARDWTYTDDQGNRWGVADGKIYLGKVALPLPFNFSGPPTVERSELQWELGDVARGAVDAGVRDSWRERAEAIRRRKDAERADSSGGGGG